MAEKRRPGRPSKLTETTKRKLIDAIKGGSYLEPACKYAGIDYSTFRKWMVQGENAQSGEYREFFEEVQDAIATSEITTVAYWRKHIPHDWKAAKEFLARRWPERWANKQQIDIGNANGDPFEVRE